MHDSKKTTTIVYTVENTCAYFLNLPAHNAFSNSIYTFFCEVNSLYYVHLYYRIVKMHILKCNWTAFCIVALNWLVMQNYTLNQTKSHLENSVITTYVAILTTQMH